MSDQIEIYHGSPSVLVAIEVAVDGVATTSGVKVCIYPLGGVEPLENDPGWQDPDIAGDDTGILVGTDTPHVFTAGQVAEPWYMVTSSPEVVIGRSTPLVRFT